MSTQHVPFPAFEGLTFRAIRQDDLDPWYELSRRVAEAENAPWFEQKTGLQNMIDSSANPVALNTVIAFDSGGVARAAGTLAHNAGSERFFAFGDVDPLWQRKGVGSAIIAWQEARLRERLAEEEPAMCTAVMRSFRNQENVAHGELLNGAGFEIVRYFSDMLRPLDTLPALVVPEGFEIRPFTADLHEPVRLAHNDAFRDHWGSDGRSVEQWQNFMNDQHLKPEWSAVAIDTATGEIAGYQLASFDPEKFAKDGRMEGYTDLLGVPRGWRGRGLAPALLIDAMARFKAAGMDHASLSVDTENPSGALGLYEGLGYAPGRQETAWDKVL